MRRLAAASALVFLALSALPAQSRADSANGMSLSDTFDFIRDSVMTQGAVVWEGFAHDSATGQDWTYQKRIETSNFSNDLPNCIISFHYRVLVDGSATTDIDGGVPLREARLIKVATEVSLVVQRDAQSGHPTYSNRLQPEIYDVDVVRGNGTDNVFSFYDEDTANRVAKAFEHAAELCGVSPVDSF
jgi:hypothetical protein